MKNKLVFVPVTNLWKIEGLEEENRNPLNLQRGGEKG